MHRYLFPYIFERTVSSVIDIRHFRINYIPSEQSSLYRFCWEHTSPPDQRHNPPQKERMIICIDLREADTISRLTWSNNNLLYSKLACSLDYVISRSYIGWKCLIIRSYHISKLSAGYTNIQEYNWPSIGTKMDNNIRRLRRMRGPILRHVKMCCKRIEDLSRVREVGLQDEYIYVLVWKRNKIQIKDPMAFREQVRHDDRPCRSRSWRQMHLPPLVLEAMELILL